MKFYNYLSEILKTDINYLEIIIYFISVIIIIISIAKSSYFYFKNIFNEEQDLNKIRTDILSNISLALSFILSIEILKIFYIKTYKQLIIVASLVVLKLIINFFIDMELNIKDKN
tara:strand:+ start:435 stop:779 length:345 start_codon:yes stop_codon:yes gene_type:complete